MKGEYISVENLIHELLKCDMSWEIQIKNQNNNKLNNCKIVAVKPEGLVCLFG